MGTFLRTAAKAALVMLLVFVTLLFTCRSSPAAGTLTVAAAADLIFAFK